MVGAGAHDGPSPIDQNMLSDLCFFRGVEGAAPYRLFFNPTAKPKFEIPANTKPDGRFSVGSFGYAILYSSAK